MLFAGCGGTGVCDLLDIIILLLILLLIVFLILIFIVILICFFGFEKKSKSRSLVPQHHQRENPENNAIPSERPQPIVAEIAHQEFRAEIGAHPGDQSRNNR